MIFNRRSQHSFPADKTKRFLHSFFLMKKWTQWKKHTPHIAFSNGSGEEFYFSYCFSIENIFYSNVAYSYRHYRSVAHWPNFIRYFFLFFVAQQQSSNHNYAWTVHVILYEYNKASQAVERRRKKPMRLLVYESDNNIKKWP